MSADPILVLQLQRLGDLILTFPLLVELTTKYPKNPVWVAAEPCFFEQLMPFAPTAVFFPPTHLEQLARGSYRAVINLSNRRDAAICAARAQTDAKLGPIQTDSSFRINGFWQLYRASLTHNNRHNLYHWADLNRLDLGYPLASFQPAPQPGSGSGRVGLFVGASEPSKRPAPEFWARLAQKLLHLGFKPILLGGNAEKNTGEAIIRQAGFPLPNFCGKTTISQLAAIIKSLDLLITPDTGPMHLAAWLGGRVLNLSIGNVQPWETGPARSGEHILQAAMSCAGCWQCRRGKHYCHEKFNPALVAITAARLLQNGLPEKLPGLSLWQTGRQTGNLYNLSLTAGHAPGLELDYLLQKIFLFLYDQSAKAELVEAREKLAEKRPRLLQKFICSIEKNLSIFLSLHQARLDADFWRRQPRHFSLLAGFLQMRLQNEDFSPASRSQAIEQLAELKTILEK